MATVLKRTRLQIWGDVIFAIFLREIRSGFNDKFGLSWAVINPVSFIFLLSYIRGMISGGSTHSMPTFVFILYGMLLIQVFLQTWGKVASAISKNRALFAFRQVQPISSVIAIAMFELLVKGAVILILLVLMYFMTIEIQIADPLRLLFYFVQMWLIACSVGLVFALVSAFIPEIIKLQSIIQRPMLFISGAFFSLQDIPMEYWHYLNWNPILHGIELSRQAAYPTFGAVGVSETFLGSATVISVSFALFCYQASWKQAISR